MRPLLPIVAALAAAAVLSPASATAGRLPQSREPVTLRPTDFTSRITNPWLPFRAGSRWIYRETSPGQPTQRTVVTVTDRTITLGGIAARMVLDVVTGPRGRVIERTRDYYAQDPAGNVWYLGEDTVEFTPGRPPSRAGSWRYGTGGAQAGIAMAARPRAGLAYRQEFLAGEAEDRARVLSTGEQVQVPAGHWSPATLIRETTPVEPRVLEYKLYARGVGNVLTLSASGAAAREELVSFRPGR